MGREIRLKIIESGARSAALAANSARKEAKQLGILLDDKNYDVIMAIGGDGTLLKASKMGKPIMAVRSGTVTLA